jgi:glutaconate CoA-transferase, subunit B
MTMGFTLEELLISRMAKEFKDGHMGVGASILSDLAARLAKALYCPDLFLTTASRAAADCDVHSKTLSDEWVLAGSARMALDWEQMFRLISQQRLQIWIGAVQIDRHGSSNISVVGDWSKPRVQLVGARGIPDDLWGCERLNYHIRRHTRHSFVNEVDFVCGFGYSPMRLKHPRGTAVPGIVISDLGVFDFDQERNMMRIASLHPGVTLETVCSKTGFDWQESRTSFEQTPAPTSEELEIIREVIDPLGLRRLESAENSKQLLLDLWRLDSESSGFPVHDGR